MEKTKSEKEKMLAGEHYNGADPALVAAQRKAQELMVFYNSSSPTDPDKRNEILKKLFNKVGANVTLRPPFYCDYGFNISIGANTFFNFNCVFLDCNTITIGENCQIAPGVQFYTATHPLEPEPRKNGLESAHPIKIGNNVWLGGNAIICPGVTIGDNTVVGTGSVVTKSLPANVLAVGNPAKVIREI